MKLYFLSFLIFLSVKIFAQKDTVKTYYPDGKLQSLICMENNLRQGTSIYYWENGNIKESRNYLNDKVFGTVLTYYKNGNRKEIYYLENGKRNGPTTYYDSTDVLIDYVIFENGVREGQDILLITKKHKKDFNELLAEWEERERNKIKENDERNLPKVQDDKTDPSSDSTYFTNVDVMPEPIGGISAIYKKINYTKEAKENNIQGIVKIKAFIEKNGTVSSSQIVEGIGYGCDENARLAVYYSRFKPGLQKGKRVKVQIVIAVEFKLDGIIK
jgi:TonB family protein